MNRREFITLLGYSASSLTVASSLWAQVPSDDIERMLSSKLRLLCNLVLPSTETPGAGDIGVGDWLIVAARSGLDGLNEKIIFSFLDGLIPLDSDLSTPDEILIRLTSIDDHAFKQRDGGELASQWRVIKPLILLGYYTSEIGAKDELIYDALPGSLDNDVTIDPSSARAWSSDWTAVMFS